MTQNPYAQLGSQAPDFGGPGGFGDDLRPSRTSALAVSSLVFALLCLVPGPGALAVLLGGAAMLVINGSRGRLKGLGLAISGTVIGLVTSIVWILILMMVVRAVQFTNRELLAPVSQVMQAVEAKNPTTARAQFPSGVGPTITDEQFAAFREAYHAELGTFRGTPQSLLDLIRAYLEIGPQMQSFSGGGNNIIPMPTTFEKGLALLLLEVDPHGGKAGSGVGPPIKNLGVWAPGSGSEIWLVDRTRVSAPKSAPALPSSSAPALPSTPSEAPAPPAPPAAPAPAAPKTATPPGSGG